MQGPLGVPLGAHRDVLPGRHRHRAGDSAAMPASMIAPLSFVAPAKPTTTPAVDTMPSLAPSTPARSQFSRVPQTRPVGLVVVVELVVGSVGHRPIVASGVPEALKARGRWCRQPRLDSRRTGIAQEGTGQTTGRPRSIEYMSNNSKTAAPKLQRLDGSPVRVLVVDDEANLTELLGMALRYEGWEVRAAGTGMEPCARRGSSTQTPSCST